MESKDKPSDRSSSAAGDDVYLPFGATDPDFYFPAEQDRAGRISKWLRSIPIFGR
ncbi:hypothetical protein [Paenarthrobacter sp. NPDC058040]|uniref:hypothetical protein n=1 Tax=unclassified Paenarthrobacter TaxID=2634190 RepID=UPI0036DD8255